MMTDPISDMLTRIRNAYSARKDEVVLPYSKIKFAIAKIMEKEGFIDRVLPDEKTKPNSIRLALKYNDHEGAINSITRISKPGRRVYAKHNEMPRVLSDFGIAIVSTPNGLMTNKEARSRKLGGEIICEIS